MKATTTRTRKPATTSRKPVATTAEVLHDAHVVMYHAQPVTLEVATERAIDAGLAQWITAASPEQKAAHKRVNRPYDVDCTMFSACRVKTAQNFKIDRALEEWHTLNEIVKQTGCTLARVRRHIKTLEDNYSLTCKRVVNPDNRQQFKFTLIEQ
ncbi:hypothetical protein [Acinetobacter sp.]|uniref:hypothetical protein n=1 Tax=Acinetobacter sp. TaxID=472 RepID=UPI003CFFF495